MLPPAGSPSTVTSMSSEVSVTPPVWPLTLSTAPRPHPDPVVGSGLYALTARNTPSSSINMILVATPLAVNRRDENLGRRAVDGRREGVIVIHGNPLAVLVSVHEHA